MSSLLVSKGPMRMFSHELAVRLGMNEAIVLQQVHYWLQKSEHEIDGHKWVYNSYEGWHEQFPYWSLSTVKRLITKLEKAGLLVSDNFNKIKYDRTKWYTIDYEMLADLANYLLEGEPEEVAAQQLTRVESLWSDSEELDELPVGSEMAEGGSMVSQAIPKITSQITSKNKKNIKKSDVIAEVIAYLNEKTDSSYKANVKKNQQVISARLEEGFGLEDFKKVIDRKTAEWSKDRYWSRFLRPTTLFGTRFEAYLNQKYTGKGKEMREEDFDLDD